MSSPISTNNMELARSAQYDTVYYQVYKQIDYIKKFKLNSELNNKEKDEQLKEYKRLIETFTENETRLKVEVESLKKNLEKSEMFKNETLKRLEFLFDAMKVLKEHTKDLENQKKNIEDTNEIYKRNNENKQKAIQDLISKFEEHKLQHQKEIESLKVENQDEKLKFDSELQNYQNEIKNLKTQIKDQLDEIRSQNKTITDFINDLASKKEQIDKLTAEKDDLSQNLVIKEEIIVTLKQKEVDLSRNVEILKENLDSKQKSEAELDENLANMERQNAELNISIEKLQTEIGCKTLEIKALEEKFQTELIELTNKKDEEFQSKINEHLKKISDLENEIDCLKCQNVDLENFKNKLEDDYKQKIDALNFQITILEKNLADNKEEITNFEINNKKLKFELESFEEKLQIETVSSNNWRKKIEDLEPKFMEKITELELVESSLIAKNDLVASLNSQIKNLSDKLTGKIDEIKVLKDQIKFKNDEIECWITKFYDLEKKLESKFVAPSSRLKRLNSNDSIQITQLSSPHSRRNNRGALKQIQSSTESDRKIAAEVFDESFKTQTIPTYQLPKKRNIKKDDFEGLENVDDQLFLRSYKKSIKESVESFRSKRQTRQTPKSILKNDPINTSTPDTSDLVDLTTKNNVSSSLESL